MFSYFVSYSAKYVDGTQIFGNISIDTKLEVKDIGGVRELEDFILKDLPEEVEKVVINNYIKMGVIIAIQ
jgi:hypothetical protein